MPSPTQHSQATGPPLFCQKIRDLFSGEGKPAGLWTEWRQANWRQALEWQQRSSSSRAECWDSQPSFSLRNQCAHGSNKEEQNQNLNIVGGEKKGKGGKPNKEFYIKWRATQHVASHLVLSKYFVS